MTIPDPEGQKAAADAFVQKLVERATDDSEKRSTTIRLYSRTFKRLKAQERRWPTTMSEMIEEGLQPLLAALENTKSPKDGDDDE